MRRLTALPVLLLVACSAAPTPSPVPSPSPPAALLLGCATDLHPLYEAVTALDQFAAQGTISGANYPEYAMLVTDASRAQRDTPMERISGRCRTEGFDHLSAALSYYQDVNNALYTSGDLTSAPAVTDEWTRAHAEVAQVTAIWPL